MQSKLLSIICGLFVIFLSQASGQILTLYNYSLKDGLISDNIQAICQDSLGYIWIGTGEGVSVFDSKEFHNYYAGDGLSSNNITSIAADKNIPGSVWIGTGNNGINKFENGKFVHFGQNLPQRMKIIYSVFVDDGNNVWCGTDSSFYSIQNNDIKLIASTIKTGSVFSIAQTKHGQILIGSSKGLFAYFPETKELKRINVKDLNNDAIICLIADKDKNIYAASSKGFLYRISKNETTRFNLKFAPRTMIEDEFNNLWIGSTQGLLKLNKNFTPNDFLKRFTVKNGLIQNNISALFIDRENILWIGTNDNGISKLTYPNLFRFKISKKYNTASWASSACDINGHFWISFVGYLMEIWQDKNADWHEFVHPLKDYYPLKLPGLTFYKNTLYVSNPAGTIYVYNISQNNLLLDSPSQINLREKIPLSDRCKFYGIYRILADEDGYLWCSALDLGVIVLNNTEQKNIIKIYRKEDGLPDNSVREIYQDHQGNMWFGGYDGGLSVFSYGKILAEIQKKKSSEKNYTNYFSTSNGLPDNGVRAIVENNSNEIIIGTRYGGLAIYKNGYFKIITKASGLISNAIWSITKSEKGNVWLGTQSGIQELSEHNKPTYKLFEELPNVPYYSICSAANGDLCFVNQTDAYIYQPLKIIHHNNGLPVYINHIFINGQESKIGTNLILGNNQNTITFEFLGIINRQQKDMIYKYRLLGIDKKWNTLINKNSITYADLGPGNYRFQVTASSGKYLTSKSPAEIKFRIQSPFYVHIWFILFVIILTMIVIAFLSRLRIKRQLEIEKLRNKIAADLHDEIGSGLTKIAILSENALRDLSSNNNPNSGNQNGAEKYSKNNSIERVGKISRGLVDSMIDVIWSIDPKYDSLQDFISNFKTYAYEVCEAKNIKLIVETTGIENIKADAQTKRSLQLMTKEALNNALKYSECLTFKVSMSVLNKNINLILEDNGCGFDINASTKGRGLFNISRHVRELNGSFNVISNKEEGTKLIIKFPVQK